MSCINHPIVTAVSSCKRCDAELCGICTRFLDSGEYCEKCASVAEAEAYLKSRNSNQETHKVEIAQITTVRIAEEEARQKLRDTDGKYVRGGIAIVCLMISMSIGLYAFPNFLKSDTQLAQEQSIMSLEECRQVFQSIGIMLSEGEIPDSSMSCPGSNIPNIVRREGNKVTISHPNPPQFGLVVLYVTNDSHRVVMVGQN